MTTASPLLFRPAGPDELAGLLRLAGIDVYVLADVADHEPVACAVVRAVEDGQFEVCALEQRPDVVEGDVAPRMLAGLADCLRARGARRLDDVEL